MYLRSLKKSSIRHPGLIAGLTRPSLLLAEVSSGMRRADTVMEVDKELPARNLAKSYFCNNTSTPYPRQRGTLDEQKKYDYTAPPSQLHN